MTLIIILIIAVAAISIYKWLNEPTEEQMTRTKVIMLFPVAQ